MYGLLAAKHVMAQNTRQSHGVVLTIPRCDVREYGTVDAVVVGDAEPDE